MFHVQNVTNEHIIVFYQTRSSDYSLGYREMTPERMSEFHSFYSSGYPVSDHSFLVTDSNIHALYVTKGMFSAQLIYKKRHEAGFSSPVVIWEAQKIEKCLLSVTGGKIYISFAVNGYLYGCVSENGGVSFARPQRYTQIDVQNLIKAHYLSNMPMSEESFFLRGVYTDAENPTAAQPPSELKQEFFPFESSKPIVIRESRKPEQVWRPEPGLPPEPGITEPEPESDEAFFSRKFVKPEKTKIEKSPETPKNENNKKLELILLMVKNIKKQNDENSKNELRFSKNISKLETEIAKINAELETLRKAAEKPLEAKQKSISVQDIYVEDAEETAGTEGESLLKMMNDE